jgi:hypothetical protein
MYLSDPQLFANGILVAESRELGWPEASPANRSVSARGTNGRISRHLLSNFSAVNTVIYHAPEDLGRANSNSFRIHRGHRRYRAGKGEEIAQMAR